MELSTTEFYRLDPLTGSHNFLSFVETLDHISAQEKRQSFSILDTDLNNFHKLNETRGHSYGDTVIRWLGIVLQEECNSPIYRMGGDEFTVILTHGELLEHEELLNRIYDRLNKEGEQLGIPSPPAKIALIHFDDENIFSVNDVMFHLWETIQGVRKNKEGTISIFWTRDLIKTTTKLGERSRDDITVLERYGDLIEELEHQILRRPSQAAVARLHGIKQDLTTLRRYLWPLREMLGS